MNNPATAAKIAAKGAVAVGSKWLGSGLELPGGAMDRLPPGVTMLGNGKVKRDRYAVYYGYFPSTKSGLTKKDFILKGKKVVSKRKSEMAKKMYQSGKGIGRGIY